ncbi:AsmA family protein [Neolewinella persica]|uniref:hypothetical protein n=1 Tax=Neolewinella persica TaxID=70998 RepID=UPI000370B69B|nr:hypothetical protein [Neolewinella persica]
MLKKILRWLLILLCVVVLLVVIAVGALVWYVNANQDKFVEDLSEKTGLEISLRKAEFKVFTTFPRITVGIDSLVVRDPNRPATEPAVISAGRLSGTVSVRKLLRDTLQLEHFELHNGGVYVYRDSLTGFNFGDLLKPKTGKEPKKRSPLNPTFDWNGVGVAVSNVSLSYLYPHRFKWMAVDVDSLHTTAFRNTAGQLTFATDLETNIKGIAFNTRLGAYLVDAPVSGQLEIVRRDSNWSVAPVEVQIGSQQLTISGEIGRKGNTDIHLFLDNEALDYEATRAYLPEVLRERLGQYHVSGPFAVRTEILGGPRIGLDPEITVDFRLDGGDFHFQKFNFSGVHTSGTFVNRLEEAEGGIPGSKKNLRIELDSTRGYLGQLLVEAPHAILRGTEGDTRLTAPMHFSGPTSVINDRVGTRDFFFNRGRFSLDTHIDASLNSPEEIITTSDGRLSLRNLNVHYRPAGLRFPFQSIALSKQEDDIRFKLQSGVLKTGFIFGLEGTLDNLLPLLLDRPADSIRTDVSLVAPRLDWTNFLAIFGEEGYFETAGTGERTNNLPQNESMKTALLGLQRTFRPRIKAHFDTVAYYDVFALTDFTTGLHFYRDTLILDKTTFAWEDSELAFGARLGLGQKQETPFHLNVQAEHLNLNRLRPSLEYFGLRLPAGLDSLPQDLNIDFVHRGIISDTIGIKAGSNVGELIFDDGADDLFTGTLGYAPGPEGLQSRLELGGDPQLVNYLFAAEDFFFGTGRFKIDLEITGTPKTLGKLIEKSSLCLEIDSSQVMYVPSGVYLPVQKFVVNANSGHTEYDLRLFSEEARKTISVTGTMDRLAAFLYPETGQTFRMKTDARAHNLLWSDIQYFIYPGDKDPEIYGSTVRSVTAPQNSDASSVDTSAFDPQDYLSATEGIFNSFRPDLSLAIDTFWTDEETKFTDVHAGLHLRDSTRLILEDSGFKLGDGQVGFSAVYQLDKELQSPFSIKWKTDKLDLEELTRALSKMEIPALKGLGDLRGTLTMDGKVDGMMDEKARQLVMDSTQGNLNLLLTDLELNDWPQLLEIGRKAKMRKRFNRVFFGPTSFQVKLDSGRVWLPRTEIQSTPLHLFVEGVIDTATGPDLLVSIPLRNIGRGVLREAPAPTGYAHAGWRVYLVVEPGKDGQSKAKFRLGRRRFFRERGRLEEFLEHKQLMKEERKAARRKRRKR